MTSESDRSQPGGLALPDSTTLAAFGVWVVFAGGAAIAIRFTYPELAPFYGAAARFALGALIFWGLAAAMKLKVPRGRALLGAVLFGALGVGGAFTLIYWVLVVIPASLLQIYLSLVPLMTLFLAAAHGLEKISGRGILGALLAVAGIVITFGEMGGGSQPLVIMIATLGAAACLAEAGVVAKYFPRNPPVITNAVGMTVGSAMLAVVSLISGEAWIIPTQTQTWLAFGYLVLVVSGVAYFAWLFALGRWTASGVSYSFVLIPLVTIVLGALLAGEEITLAFLAGATLVLGGVVLGALLPGRRRG